MFAFQFSLSLLLLLCFIREGTLTAIDDDIHMDSRTNFAFEMAEHLSQKYSQCPPTLAALPGLNFSITKTWDDQPTTHLPYNFHLQWFVDQVPGQNATTCGVRCTIEAPFFNDPAAPNTSAGYTPGLWNYEVAELFFANERLEYVEIELEPHDHYMVYLLDGYRNPFNFGEKLKLNMKNTVDSANKIWRCTVDIPLAFFPPNVRSFNAYAIHGTNESRQYEAMVPVNCNGVYTKPDFHLLQLYKKFDVGAIIPLGYNDVAFNDSVYGNLWDGQHIFSTTATPPASCPSEASSVYVNRIANMFLFLLFSCAAVIWV